MRERESMANKQQTPLTQATLEGNAQLAFLP